MINKYQKGGLTYQPFVKSVTNPTQNYSEETIQDFLGPTQETSCTVKIFLYIIILQIML